MNTARSRILLVEDNERLRRIIARALSSAGWEVSEAADAAETLRLIENGVGCDVLLSDLQIPGDIDGMALADRVRAMRPDTRVLLQTGYYDNLSSRYALLQKPYTLDQLLDAIQTVLESKDGD